MNIRKFILFFYTMSTVKSNLLVLVYYNVRGKMQPIRNLLRYLQLPYVEVHLGDQQQRKTLPEQVLNCLKGVRIEKSSLPLLVYQGLYIYDIYPIMAFLCRKFKRDELLGSNIRQKARLQEILEVYFVRLPNSMSQLFKLAESCAVKSQEDIMKEKKVFMEKYFAQSGYLKEICVYLEQQNKPDAFIFGTLTILDFLFLENCHLFLGLFNNMDEKCKCPITNMLRGFFNCGPTEKTPEELTHLTTMRNFINFMYKLPFYAKNEEYLESFSIISPHCSSFTPQRIHGIRKIWAFNKAFIK